MKSNIKMSSYQNEMIEKYKKLYPEYEKLRQDLRDLTNENKEKNINPYKFWYRSHHFEIKLNDSQLTKTNCLQQNNFIAEIQARTVFMDVWATIEYKINYKHNWNTSHETKRKLSHLNALLELADEQLEELTKVKD